MGLEVQPPSSDHREMVAGGGEERSKGETDRSDSHSPPGITNDVANAREE